MDSTKSSLIKTVLEKIESYLQLPVDEHILTDLTNVFQNSTFLHIRKFSNEFFSEFSSKPENIYSLLDNLKSKLSDMAKNGTYLKRHISENKSNIKDDNISISSSEEVDSDNSEPRIKCRRRSNQKYAIETDSDIEIIDESATTGMTGTAAASDTRPWATRTRAHHSNSKENINIHDKQTRYDFRDRKSNVHRPVDPTGASRAPQQQQVPPQAQSSGRPRTTQPPDVSEVIQIEDSSDEDVQEIRAPPHSSTTNGGPSKRTKDCPPTQPDPSQLASIPMIVQFPTMQSATFNGHLYISHNHKFSVKLQGVDPRNFRWT